MTQIKGLQPVKNPEIYGVKLTQTDSPILTTKSGWKVANFVGNDGNEYERAEKRGTVKWFKV